MKYKTIDLCAGIGGIRRGFELASDTKNMIAAEIDEWACKTYENIYHENPRNDVTDIKFKEKLNSIHYDILLAGFPCQAFSSVGLRQGFEDKTKGTIFFDIASIIKMTRPKVVFLENVQNLLSHDGKATFRTIIDTLDRQLNYHVVGAEYNDKGELINVTDAFLRNSKNFGIPQNRPRVYIIAFSRDYFGVHLKCLPSKIPTCRTKKAIFDNLEDILEDEVDAKYFLSSGYLETLEKHIINQRKKGYGFGYRIVNEPGILNPVANTVMATGGSGKERNLIYDEKNGNKYKGMNIKGKRSPINEKCIRTMTPTEWGRLQGFLGYAFLDENNNEKFEFPPNIPQGQQYKQFGNSVTIPVIEEMACFIVKYLNLMYEQFNPLEKRLYSMYGNEFFLCKRIANQLGKNMRNVTLDKLFNVVYFFRQNDFRVKELAEFLNISSARASQIVLQLLKTECIYKEEKGRYRFKNLISVTR